MTTTDQMVPMVDEDEKLKYYEGVVEGVKVRYSENKEDPYCLSFELLKSAIHSYKKIRGI